MCCLCAGLLHGFLRIAKAQARGVICVYHRSPSGATERLTLNRPAGALTSKRMFSTGLRPWLFSGEEEGIRIPSAWLHALQLSAAQNGEDDPQTQHGRDEIAHDAQRLDPHDSQ